MQDSELKKCLKIFFDPGKTTHSDQWVFADGNKKTKQDLQQLLEGKNICALHFNRLSRWRCVLLRWQLSSLENIDTHTVLFKNDGLLSSIFEAKDSWVYPAFKIAHLPKPRGLRSRIIDCLPLVIRADEIFLLISPSESFKETSIAEVFPEINQLNFMFFSNIDGKLLLVDGKSFHDGTGVVAKTTTNPQYVNVLAKEYETLKFVFEHTDNSCITPVPIKHIHGDNYDYFVENYIGGKSLREVLRAPQILNNTSSVCSIIDRLDDWFNTYKNKFKGNSKPFQELYLPLFKSLRLAYLDKPDLNSFVDKVWQALILLDQNHPGLTPVIAHNDLWPGNFVVTRDHLVAVDWERSTTNRSELFDYFWLIISSVLEYLVGLNGLQDYSAGIRCFLSDDEPVVLHARKKIHSRLEKNQIPIKCSDLFYSLFFMEWSIQGWEVLNRETEMDKLALNELIRFSRRASI